MNYVTTQEVTAAKAQLSAMSADDIVRVEDMMAERAYEIQAAFGPGEGLAPAINEDTGERVSAILFELAYKARVAKLFEDRDNA